MPARLERLIRIYNRLRRGPVTIEIITKWAKSADIKVSSRQLYRDLNALQHLHISPGENVVEFTDEKNKKTWKLEYEESEPVTQYDINSFFLFRNFIPASIQRHRKASLEKFENVLYKNFSKSNYEHKVEAAELYLRKTGYWDILYGETEHKYLEDLLWALQNKRVINITANEVNSSNIDFGRFPFPLKLMPMELLFHQGQVYIAGVEAATGKVLIYLVNNDLKFELTNDIFSRNKLSKKYKEQVAVRFGIAEPITPKLYRIKIEFTEGYGLAIQKNFLHHSVVWKKLRNGNYLLEMKCCLTRELVGFLGYSLDKVKVLQPKILRDLVVKKFRDTLEVYEGKGVDEDRANEDY
jgi:hypothetical protein